MTAAKKNCIVFVGIWAFAALAAFAVIVMLMTGCAVPHRKAVTSHTVELFRNRPDGMISREQWRDRDSGGGLFLFTDPNVQGICVWHTNQSALGGGSRFMTGPFTIVVDSNLVPFVTATGTAVGNVVGAAAATAVKGVAPIPKLP